MWFTGELVNNSIRALVERQAQCIEDRRAADIDVFFYFPGRQADQESTDQVSPFMSYMTKVYSIEFCNRCQQESICDEVSQPYATQTCTAVLLLSSMSSIDSCFFPLTRLSTAKNGTHFMIMTNAFVMASAGVHCSAGQWHWPEHERSVQLGFSGTSSQRVRTRWVQLLTPDDCFLDKSNTQLEAELMIAPCRGDCRLPNRMGSCARLRRK